MRMTTRLLFTIAVMMLVCAIGFPSTSKCGNAEVRRGIVASDSILSGMIASLLPPHRYSVEAILPPGQCPGHYDVKLSDIEKMKRAVLIVSFRGIQFMDKNRFENGTQLLVEAEGRNWMAPDSYVYGLSLLANELSKRFPEDKDKIMSRKKDTIRKVTTEARSLIAKIKRAGVFGKPIVTSSMQKEPLAWMGFRVVAEYGRPETMSVREVVRLVDIGRDYHAIVVVDNLQSGPDAGKEIAKALGVPHVVLTNFPSEKGYLSTLGENVNAVLAAALRK